MLKKIILNKKQNEVREVVCRHCDTVTNHIICSSVGFAWEHDGMEGHDDHEIIRCAGCDTFSYRIGSSSSEDVECDEEGNCFYPETEQIYPSRLMGRIALKDAHSLPEKVRSIYKETHGALCAKLKILAGVGIRTLVEAVCSEETAKGASLEKKIDDLVTKQVLTQKNAEVLHKTRILGNRATHEIEAASDAELDVAFDIVENLLETVYIIPKKAQQLI